MKKGFILTIVLIIMISLVGFYIYQMDDGQVTAIDESLLSEEINLINGEKAYRNTNYNEDFISLEILEDNRIKIEGRTKRDYDSYMVDIYSDRSEPLYRDEKDLEHKEISFNRKYDLVDGEYDLKVFLGNTLTTSDGWITNYRAELETKILVTNEDFTFPKGEIYKLNLLNLAKNNNVKMRHTSLFWYSSENQLKLRNLFAQIVGDEKDTYKQAFLVSNWVSSNIYYDLDALESGKYDITKAMDTLDKKRSICQGYANLTEALMRAGDIPARRVIGYALGGSGIENETWDMVKEDDINHVWNEVFVNGRWIIIDPTWNSNNVYEKGEFKSEKPMYSYFDISLEAFAEKHRISERY